MSEADKIRRELFRELLGHINEFKWTNSEGKTLAPPFVLSQWLKKQAKRHMIEL